MSKSEPDFWGPFEQAPNILILMTDQQRTPQHYPPGWVERNLPNLWSLMQGGVSFPNAMTNTTACSPSRATMFTSTFPMLNGVTSVGVSLNMDQQVVTSPGADPLPLVTLGQVLTELAPAGVEYQVAYKGKWHLDDLTNATALSPAQQYAQASTLASNDANMETTYGFDGWTSPDFGTTLDIKGDNVYTLAGGKGGNDARVAIGTSWTQNGAGETVTVDNAVQFLDAYQPNADGTNPFCLVVSLLNPHDIFVSPTQYTAAGYDNPDANGNQPWQVAPFTELGLPNNFRLRPDQLANKPSPQEEWRRSSYTDEEALDYVRFYAYLQTLSDRLLGQVLAAMDDAVAANTLVVRLADHGEMGMSQGRMVEKECEVYNEALLVPMIFAHPALAGGGTCRGLAGLIDIVPTLAEICGISTKTLESTYAIQGRSLASTIWDQASGNEATTYPRFLFATDDAGLTLRCLVDEELGAKYAVYHQTSWEYELYDFSLDAGGRDPETTNLVPVAGPVGHGASSPDIRKTWIEMHARLTRALVDSNTMPDGWPATPIEPIQSNG